MNALFLGRKVLRRTRDPAKGTATNDKAWVGEHEEGRRRKSTLISNAGHIFRRHSRRLGARRSLIVSLYYIGEQKLSLFRLQKFFFSPRGQRMNGMAAGDTISKQSLLAF